MPYGVMMMGLAWTVIGVGPLALACRCRSLGQGYWDWVALGSFTCAVGLFLLFGPLVFPQG